MVIEVNKGHTKHMTHTILSIYRGYGTTDKQAAALKIQQDARNLVAYLRRFKPEHKNSTSYRRELNKLYDMVSAEQYADWVGFYKL